MDNGWKADLSESARARAALEAERAAAEAAQESQRKQAEADARLEAVLQVNRSLRAALADRQRQRKESEEEASRLRARLAGRAVEEPVRQAHVAQLETHLGLGVAPSSSNAPAPGGEEAGRPTGHAGGGGKMSREAALLVREAEKLEGRIEALNQENMLLAERHQEVRKQVREQQSKTRALFSQERQLARDLDQLATRLTTASSQSKVPVDFRNLPGLCVNKLVDGLLQGDVAAFGSGANGAQEAKGTGLCKEQEEASRSRRASYPMTRHDL